MSPHRFRLAVCHAEGDAREGWRKTLGREQGHRVPNGCCREAITHPVLGAAEPTQGTTLVCTTVHQAHTGTS